MKRIAWIFCVCAIIMGVARVSDARNLMPRKIYYVTEKGAVDTCKYWAMYLGLHDVTLKRKFPGEDSLPVSVNMNLSLVSSGFVEGNGMSKKGKINSTAFLAMMSNGGMKRLEIDSIEYIYDYGTKVKTTRGEKGDLVIDLEDQPVSAKGMELRGYKMTKEYGEEMLKDEKQVKVSGFAMTKEGIQKAIADNAEAAKAEQR